MSNNVVLGFDGPDTADEVLNKLRSLRKDYLIDLEDACVVERDNNVAPQVPASPDLPAPRGSSLCGVISHAPFRI